MKKKKKKKQKQKRKTQTGSKRRRVSKLAMMLYVNLNLLVVEIEFDAIITLGSVSCNHSSNSHHFSLIMDCRTHINQIPQMNCYCETNKCADVLARMGASLS